LVPLIVRVNNTGKTDTSLVVLGGAAGEVRFSTSTPSMRPQQLLSIAVSTDTYGVSESPCKGDGSSWTVTLGLSGAESNDAQQVLFVPGCASRYANTCHVDSDDAIPLRSHG
jgi:hypothetical protein